MTWLGSGSRQVSDLNVTLLEKWHWHSVSAHWQVCNQSQSRWMIMMMTTFVSILLPHWGLDLRWIRSSREPQCHSFEGVTMTLSQCKGKVCMQSWSGSLIRMMTVPVGALLWHWHWEEGVSLPSASTSKVNTSVVSSINQSISLSTGEPVEEPINRSFNRSTTSLHALTIALNDYDDDGTGSAHSSIVTLTQRMWTIDQHHHQKVITYNWSACSHTQKVWLMTVPLALTFS